MEVKKKKECVDCGLHPCMCRDMSLVMMFDDACYN